MAKQNGWDNKNCPVSDEISDRIVRLPFYNDLFPDIDTVIDKIKEFEI
jgi:dTDP-4-amino-4,6-dideoxygalactose transaminase